MHNSTPLKRLLEEEGRKQSWLAKRVDIDPSLLSHIVNGRHPGEATGRAISDALGRTPSYFGWPELEQDGQVAA